MSKQLVYATEQQRIFTEIRENCVWIVDNCSGRCDVSVGYCKCCAARPTVVNGVGAYCSRGFRRMRQRDNPAAHFALSY